MVVGMSYLRLENGKQIELENATGALLLEGSSGPAPFYLPYEYTSVPIATGNVNPFGIDPEQTTLITVGLTSSD
jgi:hypothetical protein